MDAKYFKILTSLYDKGVGEFENISPVLLELYPGVDRMDFNRAMHESGNVERLLRSMVENNLIKTQSYSIGVGNMTNGVAWIDTTRIMAAITQQGKDAVDGEKNKGDVARLTESTIETNQSVRETNYSTIQNMRFQRVAQRWSIGLAAASVIFIGISAYLQATDQTPIKVQDLRQELQKTSDKLKQLELSLKDINQSIQKTRSDTVYVKQK